MSRNSNGIHVNPNFKAEKGSQIHLNPKFVKQEAEKSANGKVHVNPNFVNRALPPIPGSSSKAPAKAHINPNFLDGSKAKAYEEAIKMAVQGKIHVNPHFKPQISPTSALEKENIKTPPAHAKTPSAFSSATKSIFRKIGQRKLVRVKSKVKVTATPGQEPTPSSSRGSFTKIGTRKLIRSNKQSTSRSALDGKYKVKTDKKIIVRQSPRFTTPFASRKRKRLSSSPSVVRKKRFTLARVLNPFRVDRRHETNLIRKPSKRIVNNHRTNASKMTTPATFVIPAPVPAAKVSKSETPGMMKTPVPPKPARKTPVRPKPATTLINVQGVRYSVSENGRKLNRIPEKKDESEDTQKKAAEPVVAKKLFLEGEEYIEDEPGVLIRSRSSMTRQSITSYKQRSINTILKSQTRSKQYCMFYNKFGKCKKKEDGVCPYIHDSDKVAVCRKFLQGNCHKDKCLLSHKVAPEKMPVCKFYLEGVCTKDPCPYRHVKVNDSAEICPDFLKGFCPLYDKCMKRHVDVDKNGKETAYETPTTAKKSAPAKPKRKSMGMTPVVALEKKRTRYFEAEKEEKREEEPVEDSSKETEMNSSFEKKRQRLLKKVELAKQGWSGMGATTEKSNPIDLDDSGPYEEIDDDFDDDPKRPPIGTLPSFISLSGSADDKTDEPPEESEDFDERLI